MEDLAFSEVEEPFLTELFSEAVFGIVFLVVVFEVVNQGARVVLHCGVCYVIEFGALP